MPAQRTVVVTGLGATSPLGGDVPSTWEAALAGRSGARTLTEEWVDRFDLPVTFAASAAVPAAEVLPRHEAKRLDPAGQFALIAAREAWADAGRPEVEGERLGAVVASGIGGVWTLLSAYDTLRERGPRRVLPLTVPMLMPTGPAAAVGLELGARAGVHTPVSACASGAEAMAYGLQMIRDGRADVVVAGGTEAAIHPLPLAAFANMMALSKNPGDPTPVSRPRTRRSCSGRRCRPAAGRAPWWRCRARPGGRGCRG
jgi:3-oxoacyl-[acyl-carrier-protein] synthase II